MVCPGAANPRTDRRRMPVGSETFAHSLATSRPGRSTLAIDLADFVDARLLGSRRRHSLRKHPVRARGRPVHHANTPFMIGRNGKAGRRALARRMGQSEGSKSHVLTRGEPLDRRTTRRPDENDLELVHRNRVVCFSVGRTRKSGLELPTRWFNKRSCMAFDVSDRKPEGARTR